MRRLNVRHLLATLFSTAFWQVAWAESTSNADFGRSFVGISGLSWASAAAISFVGCCMLITSKLNERPPTLELTLRSVVFELSNSMAGGMVGFLLGLGMDAAYGYVAVLIFGCSMVGKSVIKGLKDVALQIVGNFSPKP